MASSERALQYATDTVKQQITLSTGVAAILLAGAKFIPDVNFWILLISCIAFGLNITFGVFSLMALTYESNQENPSIDKRAVRAPAIVQSLTFLAGLFFAMLIGLQAASAQTLESGGNMKNALKLELPSELDRNPYVQKFKDILNGWNEGVYVLPSKEQLKPAFHDRLNNAVESRTFGYETSDWAERRRSRFAELPNKIEPSKKLDRTAAETLALLYSSQVVEEYSTERFQAVSEELDREIKLPIYLVFGEAQQRAKDANSRMIQVEHVLSAVKVWWTNSWPFCAGRSTAELTSE